MARKRYNVEYISVETGEEETKSGLTYSQLESLIVASQPGDAIVINVDYDYQTVR